MSKTAGLSKLGKGLAGALAIASGTSAYGNIVVVATPADLTNSPGGANTTVNWNVDGLGGADFTFNNRYPNTTAGSYGVVWQMNMNPFTGTQGTNNLVSYAGPFVQYAFALAANTSIGPAGPFSTTLTQVVLGSKYSYGAQGINYYGGFAANGPNGSVAPGTFAFVGFRFNAADGVHFGWVRLAVNAGLIDFDSAAYETTPNTAILAGAVPEPGTMALLALGAAGILGTVIKRRRA
jgi:hypothetical protein